MNSETGIFAWLRQWITPRAQDESTALRERAVYALSAPMLILYGIFVVLDAGALALGGGAWQDLVADLLGGLALLGAYVLTRHGRVRAGGILLAFIYLAVVGFYTVREGYQSISSLLLLVAIVGAGLSLGARAGFVVATASAALYGIAALAQSQGWFSPAYALSAIDNALLFAVLVYLLAGVVAVFGQWVYRSLGEHEEVLRRQVEALEAADGEKAGLLDALREQLEQQENLLTRLQASDEARDELSSALRQIASPVIPVLEHVVVVPVTGELDAGRVERLLEDVLDEVERHGARLALLDITGVPAVDEVAADGLLRVVDGVNLLGAECVLVGIRPEVAHAVLDLGIDLSEIISRRDLQSGIEYALARTGRHIVSAQ
jgi:anti-anti-sigma regulatory factor